MEHDDVLAALHETGGGRVLERSVAWDETEALEEAAVSERVKEGRIGAEVRLLQPVVSHANTYSIYDLHQRSVGKIKYWQFKQKVQ